MSKRNSKIPLNETHPEILQFWDYEANGDLSPASVVAGTPKKAHWICSLGHKFESEIRRQVDGIRCAICSGRRVLAGFNDLATTHPDLAKEWDAEKNDLAPTEVSAGSALKAFWVCQLGHSFQTQIAIRKQGVGCAVCSNQKFLAGFNDIETQYPELAQEWDYTANEGLKPSQVLAGGNKKRDWVCSQGHRYKQSALGRRRGVGCPVCVGKEVVEGSNDLASQAPKIASEWDLEKNHPLLPNQVTLGSGRKVFWICPNGHSYTATIGSRQKTGCPICAGQLVVAGENDLATLRPEVAAQWDFEANAPLTPSEVSAGSGKRVFWKCKEGHSWQVSINQRRGCPYCTGRKVIPGVTDLATKFPSLADEWDYSANGNHDPSNTATKSHKKMCWVCPQGHQYQATVASRTSGTGCPYCAGVRILKGFNDLATKRPDIAAEWDYERNSPLKPDEVALFSEESAFWRCEFGHTYESRIDYRTQGGCPTCGGKKLIVGHNDLATVNPELAREWDFDRNGDITPADVTGRSGSKYFWLCGEGHSYESAVYARQAGNGCPRCATSGYNPAMPGLFYFISNSKLRAKKIGITNPERKTHRLLGYGADWTVIQTWYSRDGESIQTLETSALRWLRKEKGLPPYLGQEDMGKSGGWSETFAASGASDEEVAEKVELLVDELSIDTRPFNWATREEI